MTWSSPPTLGCLWRRSYPPSALFCISFLADRCFSCRYNSPSVQQGPGGGRCAVRSRHGHKGGGWCDDGRWVLLPQAAGGGGVSLCHAEPLGEGRQGTGGGSAEGAQRGQQHRQEHVDPLMGFALAPPEQASLD